jgi:serine/threonine protein kinase
VTPPIETVAPEEDHGSGDAWTVKVVDFGVAKLLDDSLTSDVSTETGSMLGTPHYMSPEQARGLKSIDARADLWAMAVIAYECLLGERPFRADTLGELVLRLCADAPPVPSSRGAVPEGAVSPLRAAKAGALAATPARSSWSGTKPTWTSSEAASTPRRRRHGRWPSRSRARPLPSPTSSRRGSKPSSCSRPSSGAS